MSTSRVTLVQALAPKIGGVQATFDGTQAEINVNVDCETFCPYACTIKSVDVSGDTPGSIVVAVYMGSASGPATSITGSTPPTLVNAQQSFDNTLTGWTVNVPANSYFRFKVLSCSVLRRAQVTIVTEKVP